MDMRLSGRYYDFDYDNNAIIMYDADDAVPSIDWDPCYESDDQLDDEKVAAKHSKPDSPSTALDALTPPESVSTDTIPDHSICDPRSASSSSLKSRKRSDDTATPRSSSSSLKRKKSGVAWISSESPKGSKRIPYAIQVAHSYTISKLKMQLTTLVRVDTDDLKKRQKAEAEAKAKRHAARLAQAQAQVAAQQYPQYQQYAAYNTPPRTAVPVPAAYRGHPHGHHPHAQRVHQQNMVYLGHPTAARPQQHAHPAAARGPGPQEVYYRPSPQ